MKILAALFIYPISILPMWVLNRFADVLGFLIYHVGGYRRKVVRANLIRSFPDKPLSEILRIEKSFYLHFCDLIFESIKTFTLSRAQLERRFVFKTPEVTQKLRTQNLAGISAHYASWEWNALVMAMAFPQLAIGVFKPLSSKSLNELILSSRQRFGVKMVPIKEVRKLLDTASDRPLMLGLLADQAPHDYEKAIQVQFLGQSTYVTAGPAVITVQRGFTPIWGWVRKVGRSRYEWGLEEINVADDALVRAGRDQKQVAHIAHAHQLSLEQAAYCLALTQDFTARLEQQIKMAPQFWLWSHRRWKSR